MKHTTQRQNDEYRCIKCHKVWATDDDDIPPCEPVTTTIIRQPAKRATAEQWKELRESLKSV